MLCMVGAVMYNNSTYQDTVHEFWKDSVINSWFVCMEEFKHYWNWNCLFLPKIRINL